VRRIPWLGLAAVAIITAGIVIAVVGHNTLRWAPPPTPPAWAAAHNVPVGSAGPSPTHSRSTAAGPSRSHSSLPDSTPARRTTGASVPSARAVPHDTPGSRPPSAQADEPGASGLPASSTPVSLDIPAINVRASVIPLGLSRNGTLAVPPLSKSGVTSWYDQGPAPGQPGAAAILGHVDAAGVGPAVFYDLGNLRPGAKIYVRLRDGQTVVFETYSVALYSKQGFPTAKVFGYTSWPTLRLITCGGEFDQSTGHYLGNVVAFASYVGSVR
jgi:Sortase domain